MQQYGQRVRCRGRSALNLESWTILELTIVDQKRPEHARNGYRDIRVKLIDHFQAILANF
jgi:hypothetical protein